MCNSRKAFALTLLLCLVPSAADAALVIAQTATNNAGTSSSTASGTFGVAPTTGDLLVAELMVASESVTLPTTPTGWNAAISKTNGTSGCYGLAIYYRTAPSSTTTYSFTLSGSAVWATAIYDITGAASGASAINANGNNANCTATPGSLGAQATSTTTGVLVLTFAVGEAGAGVGFSTPTTPTFYASDILGAFNTTGTVGSAHYLYSEEGAFAIKPIWSATAINALSKTVIVAPAATPVPPSGGLTLMGCCK